MARFVPLKIEEDFPRQFHFLKSPHQLPNNFIRFLHSLYRYSIEMIEVINLIIIPKTQFLLYVEFSKLNLEGRRKNKKKKYFHAPISPFIQQLHSLDPPKPHTWVTQLDLWSKKRRPIDQPRRDQNCRLIKEKGEGSGS